MTIPSPTVFAARRVAVPTVIDTRCGAVYDRLVNGRLVAYTCSRHGEHDRHIDCRHNVAWS